MRGSVGKDLFPTKYCFMASKRLLLPENPMPQNSVRKATCINWALHFSDKQTNPSLTSHFHWCGLAVWLGKGGLAVVVFISNS
ncbi:hypothetical protein KC19_6G184100 [Ceratodon purpureus]|uniref:Uncharacterized protein n=1 Tax=Ceratodon purpureus TaxID=3225 RepID=A0A8T0HI96_CERPU|nr:hypothetical protein KC19_6G184100 [Ceratodon purpureus]